MDFIFQEMYNYLLKVKVLEAEGESRGSNDVIRYCTTVPRQTVFDVLALKKFFTDPSIYYKRSKWSEFI